MPKSLCYKDLGVLKDVYKRLYKANDQAAEIKQHLKTSLLDEMS